MHCEICTDPIGPGQRRKPAFGGTVHQACLNGLDKTLREISPLSRVTVVRDGEKYTGTVSGVGPYEDRHGVAFEAVVELDSVPDGWPSDVITLGQAWDASDGWGPVRAYTRRTVFDDSPRYRDDAPPEAALAYEEVVIDGFWNGEE